MEEYIHYILHVTGANDITLEEQLQELWSGYGSIYRLHLSGAKFPFAIVKLIEPPIASKHPRGWNTSIGNQRKLKSYEVESHWYKNYSDYRSEDLKYPKLYGKLEKHNKILLIIEDLTCEGFQIINKKLSSNEIEATLKWLARFHARFMEVSPVGLWEIGTYWHLDTRPEEWDRMEDVQLKEKAAWIDQKLNQCKYKTIVHGDAKQANFAYKEDQIAAFDFQYVGGGCGIKDVIYFISSCLTEDEMEIQEESFLSVYFSELGKELSKNYTLDIITEMEKEWRELYSFAWADFARFINGWNPGHNKMNSYVQKQIDYVLSS